MAKTCNNCGTENKQISTVTMSSADWQRNEQRHERREKRLVWIIVLLITLLVGSNIAWLVYENSFEDYSITEEYDVEQDADGGGDNNSIINGGEIVNGEAEN